MCWKYEDEYGFCFDSLSEEWGEEFVGEENTITWLLKTVNVKIIDDEWRTRFYEFLSKCHEDEIIRPMTDVERKAQQLKEKKWWTDIEERAKFYNKQLKNKD